MKKQLERYLRDYGGDLRLTEDGAELRCASCGDVGEMSLRNGEPVWSELESEGWAIMDTFADCPECFAALDDD